MSEKGWSLSFTALGAALLFYSANEYFSVPQGEFGIIVFSSIAGIAFLMKGLRDLWRNHNTQRDNFLTRRINIPIRSLLLTWIATLLIFLGFVFWDGKAILPAPLMVMLILDVIIGVVSFVLLAIQVGKQMKSNVSTTWNNALLIVFILFVFIGLLYFVDSGSETPQYIPQPETFNGQEVLTALNEYRVDNGAEALTLDPALCNNITERWDQINANFSHDGIEEFRQSQISKGYWPVGTQVSELLATGNSVDETVDLLSGSPSHNLLLLAPENDLGCVYSNFGTTIVLMR